MRQPVLFWRASNFIRGECCMGRMEKTLDPHLCIGLVHVLEGERARGKGSRHASCKIGGANSCRHIVAGPRAGVRLRVAPVPALRAQVAHLRQMIMCLFEQLIHLPCATTALDITALAGWPCSSRWERSGACRAVLPSISRPICPHEWQIHMQDQALHLAGRDVIVGVVKFVLNHSSLIFEAQVPGRVAEAPRNTTDLVDDIEVGVIGLVLDQRLLQKLRAHLRAGRSCLESQSWNPTEAKVF